MIRRPPTPTRPDTCFPSTTLVRSGVGAANAPAYALSFEAGRPVPTNRADTMADGLACRMPDAVAVEAILHGAARIVAVSETEIAAAMRHYYTDTHNLAAGAGAAPLAALLKEQQAMAGKRIGLVLSGGHVHMPRYRKVLEYRKRGGEGKSVSV